MLTNSRCLARVPVSVRDSMFTVAVVVKSKAVGPDLSAVSSLPRLWLHCSHVLTNTCTWLEP